MTNSFKKVNVIELAVFAGLVSFTASIFAQTDAEKHKLAEQTEVWEPVPEVVFAPLNLPPSDALVLIGLNNTPSLWEGVNGSGFEWAYNNGELMVTPGTGDIKTKQSFCDIQLHIEWKTPAEVGDMQGQERNNSGLFFQQRYEVQILDSYNNKTYPNGQAASIYKQAIPLVNAMRPPGEWQQYDIIYSAPRFNAEELAQPGYITVMHNGVLVQNHVEILGETQWIGPPSYAAHGCEPLQLQDHGNKVSFRNMWVREL